MSLDALTAGGLLWLLTYALHSTLWLLAAWWITAGLAEGSERLQEWLWKVAMLAGVVTATLQATSQVVPWSGKLVVSLDGQVPAPDGPPATGPVSPRSEPIEPPVLGNDAEEFEAAASLAVDDPPRSEPLPASLIPAADGSSPRWSNWLLLGWLTAGGIGALLLGVAVIRLAFRWGLAARRITSGPLHESLSELCRTAGIRRRVGLLCSQRIHGPLAMGILRPQICVPQRALDELSPAEQQAMLAHELGHIARHDPAWLVLCRLLELVLFFQPLNRLARRRIQEAAELLCDAWAVEQTGASVSLARCLTEVAEWIVAARQPAAAVAMATPGTGLGRRVERLLENRCPDRRVPSIGLFLLLLTVPLAAWALPGFSTERDAQPVAEDERSVSAAPHGDLRQQAGNESAELPFDRPDFHSFVPRPAPAEIELEQLDRELSELEQELHLLREDLQRVPNLALEVEPMLERLMAEVHRLSARRAELWHALMFRPEFERPPLPLSKEPVR